MRPHGEAQPRAHVLQVVDVRVRLGGLGEAALPDVAHHADDLDRLAAERSVLPTALSFGQCRFANDSFTIHTGGASSRSA